MFSIVILGGLAFALWPTRFGGQALFVVVRGESMKPLYQQGDLLYARKSGDYKVGDIAIYRIPDGQPGEGMLVVHRIKRILPDGTYLFQGDNKNDTDDVTPDRAHLVGKPIVDVGDVPDARAHPAPGAPDAVGRDRGDHRAVARQAVAGADRRPRPRPSRPTQTSRSTNLSP